MGNTSSSKDRTGEETVDFGYLVPQGGIYPSANRDWNQAIVAQLIVHRKLAPFYRPLEDYEDDWDEEQILAAQKAPPTTTAMQGEAGPGPSSSSSFLQPGSSADDSHHSSVAGSISGSSISLSSSSNNNNQHHHHSASAPPHLQSATSALRHAAGKSASRTSQSSHKDKDPQTQQQQLQQQRVFEAQIYRGAVDCPICFLVRLLFFSTSIIWDACLCLRG